MSGGVEFNLLHCLAGVSLAIGCGFAIDYWVRRVRQKPVSAPSRANVKVEQPSIV
jgi:hypothetical protein